MSQILCSCYSLSSQTTEKQGLKRKSPDSSSSTPDNDSNGGYNSDDEGKANAGAASLRASSQANHAGAAAAAAAANKKQGRRIHQQRTLEDDEVMKQAAEEQDGDFPDNTDSGGKTPKTDGPRNKKKKLDDMKREERNAREKERSFRISKQINELRDLLSSGGVIVPKGTKSSVLTEAANYIRMLQQHQYRSEV